MKYNIEIKEKAPIKTRLKWFLFGILAIIILYLIAYFCGRANLIIYL